MILAAFDETVEGVGPCRKTGAVTGVLIITEGYGMIGGVTGIKYLVVVGCEGDRGGHSTLDCAILPRTHPEGDVRGSHSMNGAR